MAKKKSSDRLRRGISVLMDKAAAKETAPAIEQMGKKAVAWLKKQAIGCAGEYRGDRHYNCGDVVRGLRLGDTWKARQQHYSAVMRGLKRAEELGFVEAQRHGSPMGFRYVGPEVEAAKVAVERSKRLKRKRLQMLANKTRIKGIQVESSRYSDDGWNVQMTPEAFEKLAAKAGVKVA